MSVTEDEIVYLFRSILGRPPESEAVIRSYAACKYSFDQLRALLLSSEEFYTTQGAPPIRYQVVELPSAKGSISTKPGSITALRPHDPFRRYSIEATRKRLKIYAPCVHPSRTAGFANGLSGSGHQLIVSDQSSATKIFREVPYTPEEARMRLGEHVTAYCGEDFFEDPPDVMIVGRADNEPSMFALFEQVVSRKPIVLTAISGLFQETFTWPRYDGVLCCDLPSRVLARAHGVPAIRCAETDWLNDYPARPMPQGGPLRLRSFINHFADRFPLAHAFYEDCRRRCQETFGDKVIVENIDGRSREEVKHLIAESAMLLHIKDSDGFGWSVLESLFIGRPVVYQTGLAKDMTYLGWLDPGVSGFPVEHPADLIPLTEMFLHNPRLLAEAHRRTAESVRVKYDGPELIDDVVRFLEDLHRVARMRWLPNFDNKPTRQPRGYQPSLDPAFVQDYENIWREKTDRVVCPENI